MDGDDDHANAHTAQETVAVALGLYSVPYQSNCEQNTFDEQFGAAVSQYIPTIELYAQGVRKRVVDL